jgi:predicted nucleic acid-binding protein
MMRFLCDTNVISGVMHPLGNPRVVEWFEARPLIRVSVITVEEVHAGLAHKGAQRQLTWFAEFLEWRVETLPVTEAIARRGGILRGQFRKRGLARTQADMLIAATALEDDLILATRNTRDFEDCGLPLFNPFR